MSVVAHAPSAGPSAGSQLPQRPAWVLSVPLDGGLAVGAYLAAYWLRFQGDRLETFLPGAWSTMPVVVAGQLAALVVAGAYSRRPRVGWILRVLAGVVTGTVASSMALGVTIGFEGVTIGGIRGDERGSRRQRKTPYTTLGPELAPRHSTKSTQR